MRLALIKGHSYTYMTRTMESLLTVLSGLAPFALVFGLIGVLVAVVLGVRFDRRQQKKIWKVKNEVKSHLNTYSHYLQLVSRIKPHRSVLEQMRSSLICPTSDSVVVVGLSQPTAARFEKEGSSDHLVLTS